MQDKQENTQPEIQVRPDSAQPQEQQPVQASGAVTIVEQSTNEQTSGGASNTQVNAAITEPIEDGGAKKSKKWVVVLMLVIIVGVGAVVGGYLVGRRAKLARQQQREERVLPTPIPEERDSLTEVYENLSSSDEVSDIEKDLDATTFEGLDKELADIDNELASQD